MLMLQALDGACGRCGPACEQQSPDDERVGRRLAREDGHGGRTDGCAVQSALDAHTKSRIAFSDARIRARDTCLLARQAGRQAAGKRRRVLRVRCRMRSQNLVDLDQIVTVVAPHEAQVPEALHAQTQLGGRDWVRERRRR